VFLSTLLRNFGKTPSIPFIAAITELVNHDPEVLVGDLVGYMKDGSLRLTTLMLSPLWIKHGGKSHDVLFDLAIAAISDPKTGLNEFDEACRTLSEILRIVSVNRDEYGAKMDVVNKAMSGREIPAHLKLLTLQVTDDVEDLSESDSPLYRSTKLKAFAFMFVRNPSKANLERVLAVFRKVVGATGEEYSKFLEAFAVCFSKISCSLIRDEVAVKREMSSLLEFIMTSVSGNWVNKVAVLKLLQAIDIEIGVLLIRNFERRALEIAVRYYFSNHTSLARVAQKTLEKMARMDNLATINGFL
jgi:hypothetical protein